MFPNQGWDLSRTLLHLVLMTINSLWWGREHEDGIRAERWQAVSQFWCVEKDPLVNQSVLRVPWSLNSALQLAWRRFLTGGFATACDFRSWVCEAKSDHLPTPLFFFYGVVQLCVLFGVQFFVFSCVLWYLWTKLFLILSFISKFLKGKVELHFLFRNKRNNRGLLLFWIFCPPMFICSFWITFSVYLRIVLRVKASLYACLP